MRGTPTQLDGHYLSGEGPMGGWAKRITDSASLGHERGLADLFSLFGANYSSEETTSFVMRVVRRSGLAELLQKAQQAMEKRPPDEDYIMTCYVASTLLPRSIDPMVLPEIHPTWTAQHVVIADGGTVAIGRLVYLALRVGLLSVRNPLPASVNAFVVAADISSLDGTWTDAVSRDLQGSQDEAWGDDYRVYVLLPRGCLLGPGSTGRVSGLAYGIGWAHKLRLENYTDTVMDRGEVLLASRSVAHSGFPSMIMTATVFMVDKGSRMALLGWSGVLSVMTLYRAGEIYASRQAMYTVLAVRHGDAPFASTRDLPQSMVPTIIYPALALGAEAGRRTFVGPVLCAGACFALLASHGFKLSGLGIQDTSVFSRIGAIAAVVAWSPLAYRLAFYAAYTSIASMCIVWFMTGSPFRPPDMCQLLGILWLICSCISHIVEIAVVVGRLGWDPEPTSTAINVRWGFALLATLVAVWGQVSVIRGSAVPEPVPYKLGGWSHREAGSNKASRHIVEYGTGERVVEEEESDLESGDYYALWKG